MSVQLAAPLRGIDRAYHCAVTSTRFLLYPAFSSFTVILFCVTQHTFLLTHLKRKLEIRITRNYDREKELRCHTKRKMHLKKGNNVIRCTYFSVLSYPLHSIPRSAESTECGSHSYQHLLCIQESARSNLSAVLFTSLSFSF